MTENTAKAAAEKPAAKTFIKKPFATVEAPLIAGIINDQFRYDTEAQAAGRLKQARKAFPYILADNTSLTLWIKGYALTPALAKQNFMGNYARLFVSPHANGGFTLKDEAILLPLSEHPMKKRPSHKHPNWAHPIMRTIKKKKIYPDLDAARLVLIALHEEFKDTSIPATDDRLYIHIYSKSKERHMPIVKIVLKATTDDDGQVFIDWRENNGRKKRVGGGNKTDGAEAAVVAAAVMGGLGR